MPWVTDATRDATLSALRAAYPLPADNWIDPEIGFALVRGKAGICARHNASGR
jgi:hypothetical protein